MWSMCCPSARGPRGSPPWLSSSGRLDWTLHCMGTQSSNRTSWEAARLLRPRLWNLQDRTSVSFHWPEQGARPRMWTIGGTIHYFNILPQLLAYPCLRVWNNSGHSILWRVDNFIVLSANFLHGFSGNYFVPWDIYQRPPY